MTFCQVPVSVSENLAKDATERLERARPCCLKHRKLNELIKRSTCYVFNDLIT